MEKKLTATLATVQAAHPAATVETWSQDEARLGLFPILRRVWAPRGQRPIAQVAPRHIWEYVYTFVHPASGTTHTWLCPSVNIATMSAVLAAFAEAVEAGPNKQVIIVLDQAGWHVSPKLSVPAGLHLEFLPSHSPELQPTERIWPLVREVLANHTPPDRASLCEQLEQRCAWIANHPELVQALTNYHWWPPS